MINLSNVSFSYNKKAKVFDNLSLQIDGGLTYILGPNGAGKSTLIQLIMGILKAEDGIITIDGENINKKKLSEIGKHNGYLFQNPDTMLFANTVIEELTFALELQGIPQNEIKIKAEQALKIFGLTGREQEFPLNLSLGQRQRLALATIFMREPDRYILDEPTAMLDYSMKEDLYELFKELIKSGKEIIIATHDMELIDRVKGRIINLSGKGELL